MNNLDNRTAALNKYQLPVPKNSIQRIDRSTSPAHIGKLRNAIDFIVPENTPVLAAADGIITYVKDDSNIGGPNPAYWNFRSEERRVGKECRSRWSQYY